MQVARTSCRLAASAIATVLSVVPAVAGGSTLGHSYPEGSAVDRWAIDFAQCIGNDRHIYVDVVGGGKLGRSDDLVQSLFAGFVDMVIVPARSLRTDWPDLAQLAQSEAIFRPAQMMQLSQSSKLLNCPQRYRGEGTRGSRPFNRVAVFGPGCPRRTPG